MIGFLELRQHLIDRGISALPCLFGRLLLVDPSLPPFLVYSSNVRMCRAWPAGNDAERRTCSCTSNPKWRRVCASLWLTSGWMRRSRTCLACRCAPVPDGLMYVAAALFQFCLI